MCFVAVLRLSANGTPRTKKYRKTELACPSGFHPSTRSSNTLARDSNHINSHSKGLFGAFQQGKRKT
jgi:hypothetical protein